MAPAPVEAQHESISFVCIVASSEALRMVWCLMHFYRKVKTTRAF